MLIISSSIYFVRMQERREEENNNNNMNGYYNYYWLDGRELLAYHQKVVAYVCLALAIAYFAISTMIYSGARMLPESSNANSIRRVQDHAHVAVQFDLLSEFWTFLSLATIVVIVALFVASLLQLGGEEAERQKEEGKLINLTMILVWMIVDTIVLLTWGNEVFNVKKLGSLGMGILYGGTKYFAAMLLMVCVLFANLTFDERKREEEGTWVSTATSVACLVLSLIFGVFAMRARKYQVALIDSSEDKVTVLNSRTGMVHGTTGDFVRIEEEDVRGIQMT